MQLISMFYFLLPFLGVSQMHTKDNSIQEKLFVCYGKVNPELVKGYALVIIESGHYSSSEIAVFNKNNKKVVAYLSLSEVNEYASFYKEIKPYTLGKNDTWNSHFIDIKNKNAQQVLLNEINRMQKKGVQGLFLDNLDNVSKWGNLYNQKEEFISFLKNLKSKNKDIYLVQNGGLFLAKDFKNITNAILIESVISSYNFEKKEYKLRDKVTKKQIVENLRATKKQVKKPIYIIEYAETLEMKTIINKELKKMGFSSFVGQIDLQTIPKFKSN
ncbi:uncharacterized protein (TIGR01370 family) [Maribacter vaceletii]|uniref:Uncharacterized protein (TIGR01370 family) n=2 Tax=Maribacter vaceletii TaxID=1206816 RepID=A0A495ED50_9FLAO|nr:uncharacterized protein (TIGR01370 family) [Maribacter vaceletii]